MKYSSIEGLTLSCLRYSIFTSQSYGETQLDEVTREESYGERKLESREQSYGGTKLESNEQKNKLQNKVTEKRI